MNTKKEMTAPITSVGADEEQSNSIKTNTTIGHLATLKGYDVI